MISTFDIKDFISKKITNRDSSFFAQDLSIHKTRIEKEIKNQSVLVIGGAGTIGSSYILTLLKYSPYKLVVVDINENGLTELVRECRSRTDISLPNEFKSYPINFNDRVFDKILAAEGPFDIIANFAAHKHVRSEKDIYSIEALLKNNVIEAGKLLEKLVKYPPKHFFCVSTDKAANPINIMGASKKLMELLIMSYASKINVTTARFANVAFSNGSLLAGYLERIPKHQPLSCPNDVKRFFVSPEEAGQICLLASVLGNSGEIFFPKLDTHDLVSFADITLELLKSLNYEVKICQSEQEAKENTSLIQAGVYPVYFFKSETSGEKLYEEFFTPQESPDMTTYESLGVIPHLDSTNSDKLFNAISQLELAFEDPTDKKIIVQILESVIPEFNHHETGMNLDQKM